MADEFDMFGQLNDYCSTNVLAQIKKTLTSAPTIEMDDDTDLDSGFHLQKDGRRRKRKTAVKDSTVDKREKSNSPEKNPESENLDQQREVTPPLPARRRSSRRAEKDAAAAATAACVQTPPNPTRRKGGRRKKQPTAAPQESVPTKTTNATPPDDAATLNPGHSRRRRQAPRAQITNDMSTITMPISTVDLVALDNGLANDSVPSSSQSSQREVMRARRAYISGVAARATNVGYIDLITAPVPVIEGLITVGGSDSEEEVQEETKKLPQKAGSLFDEENPNISVKIRWHSVPEVFKLRKYQKFTHIFNTLAEREQTAVENIVLNLNNCIIKASDSPASIDYKIYQFIDGRILMDGVAANGPKKRDANSILLKVQSDKWKRPLEVEFLKTDKFKILYIKCAEELNIPLDQFKLSFDGESLEYAGVPSDLEFEGGEVIDLRFEI